VNYSDLYYGLWIFPFSETLKLVVGPTQSPRQRQAGDASREVRILLPKADNHPHIVRRVRMSGVVNLLLLYASKVCKGTILPSLFTNSLPYISLIFLICYISLPVMVSFSVDCHAWPRSFRWSLIVLYKVNYICIFHYLGSGIKFPYICKHCFLFKYWPLLT